MNQTRKIPAFMGDGLLLITAIVWGGGFIGVQKALDVVSPYYMIAFRFAIASVLMIILFWKPLIKARKEDIRSGIFVGFFLFIGFVGQTVAAKYIGVGKLAFLTALNVIIVPFLAFIIFREKIKKYNIIASCIAVVGFAFLNLTKESGFTVGIGEVLAISGAIGFAGHIAFLGEASKKRDARVLAVMQMVTCATLGFVCAFIFEKPPTTITSELLLPVAYLGILSTFVAFLCQTIGQKYTSASRAAIILCMESVFGIVLSILLLGEQVTLNIVIGATLILASVIFAEYRHAVQSE